MKSINDYSEYLAALKDLSSKDPSVRNEANRALRVLQNEDPERFTLYRVLHGEIKPPKEPEPPKAPKKVIDKEQFIHELSANDIQELRKKARAKLLRGPYGLNWRFDTPSWISDEDMLKSFDELPLSDLITKFGNLVQRNKIIQLCINFAVAKKRIDEEKLRKSIQSLFSSYYNRKIIGLSEPYLFEPVRRMLYEDTTVEELVNVVNGCWDVDIDKLVELVNSKQIKVTDEELERHRKKLEKQAKQSKNARKRAKRRAEKKAALKKALEDNKEASEENEINQQ